MTFPNRLQHVCLHTITSPDYRTILVFQGFVSHVAMTNHWLPVAAGPKIYLAAAGNQASLLGSGDPDSLKPVLHPADLPIQESLLHG